MLLPGIALSAFTYSFVFVLGFAIFAGDASTGIFSMFGEAILLSLLAVMSALIASLPALLLLVIFWLTMSISPNPDLFSSLIINWSMIPIGYGAVLLVGFSAEADSFYPMTIFASATVFGSLFGILYSRLIIRIQMPVFESRIQRSFSLRSMFVTAAWVAVLLAGACSSGLALFAVITLLACSLLGWGLVAIFPGRRKPRLAKSQSVVSEPRRRGVAK